VSFEKKTFTERNSRTRRSFLGGFVGKGEEGIFSGERDDFSENEEKGGEESREGEGKKS